jgi:hypothetical protein
LNPSATTVFLRNGYLATAVVTGQDQAGVLPLAGLCPAFRRAGARRGSGGRALIFEWIERQADYLADCDREVLPALGDVPLADAAWWAGATGDLGNPRFARPGYCSTP